MNKLQHFLECYFHFNESFDDLDQCIQNYKKIENNTCQYLFIKELYHIIQTKNYILTSQVIEKYGFRSLNKEKTKKLILLLYNRFINKHTNIKPQDFEKKFKGIFCPVCCSHPETATFFSLIEKAIIRKNSLQIYICKPCKLVWFTENIHSDNAQDYKKFMNTLSLKGLRKN